jgi:hypothetical protein
LLFHKNAPEFQFDKFKYSARQKKKKKKKEHQGTSGKCSNGCHAFISKFIPLLLDSKLG